MKKTKIIEPALKVKKTGKVLKAPSAAYSHEQVEMLDKVKDKAVQRGFETNKGRFVGREEAAKIAKKAGEVKTPGKKLHSHELRQGLGVKKKVF